MNGQVFGNYVVRAKIGEGGMGEVFLAEHRRIGRRAAIKVLRAHGCANAHDVERFFNEARAASIIDHPGVVQIFDCDFHENVAYLIMEYLEGESLAVALRRAHGLAADPEAIREIGCQIANVLAAAHGKGIVHRDLKPDNVFLEVRAGIARPFLVRILDFGIAKLTVADAPGLTKSGTVLGTPTYMAPEQCAGDRDVDARADIYSLGCMLFEMAAGRPPFVLAGAGSLITAHMSERPPSLDTLWAGAPAAFVALVGQMLAKDTSARPQTMAEVEERLRRALTVAVSSSPLPDSAAGSPLVTATVSFATQRQVVETAIDPMAVEASSPAESVRTDDSLPGPTVSLPTGHGRTGSDRAPTFLGMKKGRHRSGARALGGKKLPIVVAGAVATLAIVGGLVGTRRNGASNPASRAIAPAVVESAPTASAPPTVELTQPQAAAPAGPVEQSVSPAAESSDEAQPRSDKKPPSRGDSPRDAKRDGKSSPSEQVRSAASRRAHPKLKPTKEIRGFSDF